MQKKEIDVLELSRREAVNVNKSVKKRFWALHNCQWA
jgi:hypothetical protein